MSDLNYKNSGVDIDEGNRFVSLIKSLADSTKTDGVIGGLGGFAGFFSLQEAAGMKEPVLVSGTDGVGTKLKVAIDSGRLDTVGIDLVAMCANDVIVTGAKPLFFLDYLATGKLSSESMAEVVKGIAEGCKQAGAALIGGETAEMPGFYADGDFDVAGFVVGLLDKAKVIDGSGVRPGDVIVGLPSSGLHSNGYSLARKIFFEHFGLKGEDRLGSSTVYDMLLEPTRIYVKPVLSLLDKGIRPKAMSHITGGGFYENIPRTLPINASAVIDPASFSRPEIYDVIEERSGVESRELYRVFNMGIGYMMVLAHEDAEASVKALGELGEDAFVIGEVTEGKSEVFIKGIDC
ncbi:phosphoribosylformylglycinamidine cyclo-ligase [Limisalsivibrio acetivorans]|uniref:phosphoribosylformylglycinamidine cyclo-ligase n=1 Tax=Limisalsivibrio acetivorans TaxID=1304888 RepID=UPI0003B483BF|nr:phosphoribosylformylglycinamidine cyclo-ligase [Limisalsivibrio acetivorans]